jgi:DNA-binding MarR family transcriptional regulator
LGKSSGTPRRGGDIATDPPATISFGSLPNKIGFHLRLAQEASFRAFAQRVGDPELKPQRFTILHLIAENPGISQTSLSRCSGRDKSTLTPTLTSLVQQGLIERRVTPIDRRRFELHITPAGTDRLAALARHAEAHDRELDRIVGLDSKTDLVRLLRRITLALGETTGQPDRRTAD